MRGGIIGVGNAVVTIACAYIVGAYIAGDAIAGVVMICVDIASVVFVVWLLQVLLL